MRSWPGSLRIQSGDAAIGFIPKGYRPILHRIKKHCIGEVLLAMKYAVFMCNKQKKERKKQTNKKRNTQTQNERKKDKQERKYKKRNKEQTNIKHQVQVNTIVTPAWYIWRETSIGHLLHQNHFWSQSFNSSQTCPSPPSPPLVFWSADRTAGGWTVQILNPQLKLKELEKNQISIHVLHYETLLLSRPGMHILLVQMYTSSFTSLPNTNNWIMMNRFMACPASLF